MSTDKSMRQLPTRQWKLKVLVATLFRVICGIALDCYRHRAKMKDLHRWQYISTTASFVWQNVSLSETCPQK